MDWDNVTDRLGVLKENVGRGFMRIFGSRNERVVRTLEPIVKRINELEPWAQGLDQSAMQETMVGFRKQVQAEEKTLDELLPEVFALVREASVRTLGMRHFDVQLVGGYVLHSGAIAEMMTGEGKTLVATLALSLNAVSGRPCYLVTVNDYLAKRDGNWMRPIYEYLGLTIDSIQAGMEASQRKPVYACDIVYGTNNEFGFDYLRDNMKTTLDQQVQSDLYYAIVDEVDSALIDEARTPLIISGPAEEHVGKYHQAHDVASKLEREVHYEVKEKERSASLLEDGIVEAQKLVGVESFYQPGCEDWPHYIENALRAKELYTIDKEYVIEGAEVVIVDEFTGRKMAGRRWSEGLHQAVEVKEGLQPKTETQTLATITFQNYFRMFEKLGGMTGTAITEAGEFHSIYELEVVSIPTNLAAARDDGNDVVYRTENEKWNAICDEIERVHEKGQPLLVGTASVESSEHLAGLLRKRNLKHEVLNAKNHEREADIIAMAGERGGVTVATNMAGRGTDIKLGGNFEYRLGLALSAKDLVEGDVEHLEQIDAIREDLRSQCDTDEAEVLGLGGLYVLGTERHEARRIDNQLRGRSGRQGNVGESRFYLSLQDPLMRIFYRDWVTNAMEKLGMTEGQEIESGMVTRAIGRAQKKVEERNFEIRKSLLEYDEVMDRQRKTIYGVRQDVLENTELKQRTTGMIVNSLQRATSIHVGDADGLKEWCMRSFGLEVDPAVLATAVDPEGNSEGLESAVLARLDERHEELGDELFDRVQQYLLLNALDSRWKDHLYAVDALKAGIGLRGYGQEDPKVAYKKEGTLLFNDHLLPAVEEEVASLVLRIQVRKPDESGDAAGAAGAGSTLTPHGMVRGGGGRAQATPEQVEAYRRQVKQQQVRRAMRPQVAASSAFDVMRRRQQTAVAPKPQEGQEEAQEPKPEQAPAQEPAADAADYSGVGRNDACPCGSGKKFKKCHGTA
ncbi:MAG: preprotein translocase subunit SecA [Chlamydiales bacterium]|jgi:preprotein translocase subunit SecA